MSADRTGPGRFVSITLKFAVGLVAAAFLAAGCAAGQVPGAPAAVQQRLAVQEISMDAAVQAWRTQSAVIVDVRTPEEFKDGHIPGAVLIPLADLERRKDEIPKDRPVLLICRSANRSAQANLILQKQGYTNTRSVNKGMVEWPETVER